MHHKILYFVLWFIACFAFLCVFFSKSYRFIQRYIELRARIKANSCPVLPATTTSIGGSGCVIGNDVGSSSNKEINSYSVQRSASLKDHRQLRYITIVVQ